MILVTGGTGLVGSHLLYRLSLENEDIIAIHRKSSNMEAVKKVFSYYTADFEKYFSKIAWREADINDISALQDVFNLGIDQVYHSAAMVSFDPKDYHLLRKINIKGTANIVNLSLEWSVQKLCYVSSVAAIDAMPNKQFITEDNEWNPELKHHGYAISKFGAEMEVWRGTQEGLNAVIVNPGVILGAGFWNSGSGKLFSSVANGFKYYTEGKTGFVGIEDVVKVMISLMKKNINNKRFVLVSENVSFKTVLFEIADNLNKKRPSIKVSKIMSEIVWRLAWLQSFLTGKAALISKNSARSGHHISLYSSEKVKRELGFEFELVSNSIQKTCEYYKKDEIIL